MDVDTRFCRSPLPLLSAAILFALSANPAASQQAVLFGNYGDYLEIRNDTSLAAPEFTIEFWLQVRDLALEEEAGGEQTIMDTRGAVGGLNIRLAGTKWPISIFSFNGPDDSWSQALGAINPYQWIHVASVQNADSAKLYLNGRFVDGRESTYIPEPVSALRIGDLLNSPDFSYPLRGALDEVRMWNHERPPDSILAHVHNAVPPSAPGLTLYLDFDDAVTDTVYDRSPFGNNAAIFGTTRLVESSAPVDWIPPPIPYGLRAFGGEGRVDLVWKSYGPPVDRYQIHRGDSANFAPDASSALAVVRAPDTTYTDDVVEHGRFYYYRLRTKDAGDHASETGHVAASRATVIDAPYLTGVHYNSVWGPADGGREWQDRYMRQYLVPPQAPLLGEYSSRDPLIIRQHLSWMEEYGIDFILPNWWSRWSWTGITVKDYLLDELANSSIKFAVMIRTARFGQGAPYDAADRDSILTVFTYLSDYFFSHPNYLEIDGRKVVFLNAMAGSTGEVEEAWTAVRDSMASLGHALYMIGDDVRFEAPDATHMGFLDAVYPYSPYVANEHFGYAADTDFLPDVSTTMARWNTLATEQNIAFVPSVIPGYNQRYGDSGSAVIPRQTQQGAASTSLLEDFIRSMRPFVDPQLRMMLVNSWNIWDGDTEIEPVAEADPTNIDVSPGGHFYSQGYMYEGDGMMPLTVVRRLLASELTVGVEPSGPEYEAVVGVETYPNPFVDRMHLRIVAPQAGETVIEVYDVLGRTIETLAKGRTQPGQLDVIWDAANRPPGVYLIRIQSGTMRRAVPIVKASR